MLAEKVYERKETLTNTQTLYTQYLVSVPTLHTCTVVCKPVEEEGGQAECLAVQEARSGTGEEEDAGAGSKTTSCTHAHHGMCVRVCEGRIGLMNEDAYLVHCTDVCVCVPGRE